MAKIKAAASIQTSPMAKVISKSLERFPLVINRTTPIVTIMMPIALLRVINSRKTIRDKMTMKTGKVIAIKERLIAVVVWPAT